MVNTCERWHDGIGYDLDLIETGSPEERSRIETLLLSRSVDDWRDVEALAVLGTPLATARLQAVLEGVDKTITLAVLRYAPRLFSNEQRIATLLKALEHAGAFDVLTQVLEEIETFHPPEIVVALLRETLAGDGESAVHLAAMSMFVHGKAQSAFDWDQRPFFLRFNTEDRGERESAFIELCEKIGVSADTYIAGH